MRTFPTCLCVTLASTYLWNISLSGEPSSSHNMLDAGQHDRKLLQHMAGSAGVSPFSNTHYDAWHGALQLQSAQLFSCSSLLLYD